MGDDESWVVDCDRIETSNVRSPTAPVFNKYSVLTVSMPGFKTPNLTPLMRLVDSSSSRMMRFTVHDPSVCEFEPEFIKCTR